MYVNIHTGGGVHNFLIRPKVAMLSRVLLARYPAYKFSVSGLGNNSSNTHVHTHRRTHTPTHSTDRREPPSSVYPCSPPSPAPTPNRAEYQNCLSIPLYRIHLATWVGKTRREGEGKFTVRLRLLATCQAYIISTCLTTTHHDRAGRQAGESCVWGEGREGRKW